MQTAPVAETHGLALAYVAAASNYWLDVFPRVRRQSRHWRARAHEIPDAALRTQALSALSAKASNVEGAAAFAAFVPRSARDAVVRAQVAFQTIYDYLDDLGEQANSDPIANGRQLQEALIQALDSESSEHPEYYASHARSDDGGYLREMVDACRGALRKLPSYAQVAPIANGLAEHAVRYQSLNLTVDQGGHRELEAWARSHTPSESGLRWWETAASAGSSLGIFALMATAAEPAATQAEAMAIMNGYWPWTGALHSLLDHVADEVEDSATRQRNFLDYYSSPQEAAWRLNLLASESIRSLSALPNAREHTIILAGMVGSYLSPTPRTPMGRPAAEAVLAEIGPLARPTALVFRMRWVLARLSGVHRALPLLKRGQGAATAPATMRPVSISAEPNELP